MPANDMNLGAEPESDLKEAAGEKVASEPDRKLFGTFGGVFTPTLLTILGVIMYLREGWVVGNAGLLGAWAIILLAFGITAFTGLSLSSITTNIRIGAGGAFNIISQSLGLEVGGSIGIPLYLSQTLAVAMYVFGFRAGWLWIFPDHHPLLVDLGVFLVLFVIAFISASLAFRIQYLILAIIVCSLISVAWAGFSGSMEHAIRWWGEFRGSPENNFTGVGFWAVFAVFFPASTGIMAGANMSGDLKNPRRSIPIGTMAAIGLSLLIYLALAFWLATSATDDELVENYTVMIDRAAWGPAVLAGLLGATFSSALSSLVGGPRILQALAQYRVTPYSDFLSKRTSSGEPRNAMLPTAAIILAALMLRDLNAVAPLITMFFLVTYAMINVVVMIEQHLRLVSFRPLLRIPRFVPVVGALGCIFAMFIVNLAFGLLALVVVAVLHAWLVRRHLEAPFGDVRSGLFVAMAEWAAKKVESLAGPRERTWKANILAPVEVSSQAGDYYELLRDIAFPKGFVRLLGLTGKRQLEELQTNLPELAERFQKEDVFSTWSIVDAASFGENLAAGMQALGGAFFRSNILFLRLPPKGDREEELKSIIRHAANHGIGVLLHATPERPIPERKDRVAVWIARPDRGWKFDTDLGNMDLALLTGYKLKRNWNAGLYVVALLDDANERDEAERFLSLVVELARIPNAQTRTVVSGREEKATHDNPASITIFAFDADTGFDKIRRTSQSAGGVCLFTMDSGGESALV